MDLPAGFLPGRHPLAAVAARPPPHDPPAPGRTGVDDAEVAATAPATGQALSVRLFGHCYSGRFLHGLRLLALHARRRTKQTCRGTVPGPVAARRPAGRTRVASRRCSPSFHAPRTVQTVRVQPRAAQIGRRGRWADHGLVAWGDRALGVGRSSDGCRRGIGRFASLCRVDQLEDCCSNVAWKGGPGGGHLGKSRLGRQGVGGRSAFLCAISRKCFVLLDLIRTVDPVVAGSTPVGLV